MPRAVDTLADRVARYERIIAMTTLTPKLTHEQIGLQLDPPLTKERVRQIIAAGRPQPNGRPPGPKRRAKLTRRLQHWESQLAAAQSKGNAELAADARARIADLSRALGALGEREAAIAE